MPSILPTAISDHYPVMEHFLTLQGEGFHTGRSAYFVRLGGCDVGCVWCDVKDSWDGSKFPTMNSREIGSLVSRKGSDIVVVTGGEPAMHDLTPLCDALHQAGRRVHIETSGAHPLRGSFDWVTLSPKKFKAPLPEVLAMAHELKVVVYNQSDFDWAEQHAASVPADCLLYLQAEWSRKEKIYPAIVSYIEENPRWRLSLQSHKYINIP
jgi:7-carboxy-7-deazaguanine synthase